MLQITEELTQSILNYMANRPYVEVYLLIPELQKMKVVEEKKEEEKKESE